MQPFVYQLIRLETSSSACTAVSIGQKQRLSDRKGTSIMKWIDHPGLIIPYYTFESFEREGVTAAFTTRLYVKDGKRNNFFQPLRRPDSDPDEVSRCLDLLVRQFGIDREHLVPSAQEHTSNIHTVTAGDIGPVSKRIPLESIDGLITNRPGVMLQAFGADCPSVYLYDPIHRAIGLCHSGRKGTQMHIADVMLRKMSQEFGTEASDVLAAVSPGICADCYDVDDEVAEDFARNYLPDPVSGLLRSQSILDPILIKKTGRYHIDLFAAISHTLKDAGVPGSHIEMPDMCTRCRSDLFYSFRAEGRITNENCAIVMLRP